MKRERVSNYIRNCGALVLIIISLIEMATLIFLFMMNITIDGNSMNFFSYAMNLGNLNLFVLWVSFLIVIFSFLIIGLLSIKLAANKELDDYNYSKHMFIMGVIILIAAFIQWEYKYLIESYLINGYLMDGIIFIPLKNIRTIFHYFDISFYLWLVFSFTSSSKVVLGLVCGGFGLYWVAEKEKEKEMR
jgi:hypothetical protein